MDEGDGHGGARGEKGEPGLPGERGPRGRDAESGLRGYVNTLLRSLGLGVGGGGIASLIATVADPHGPSAVAGAMIGVAIGGVNGLGEVGLRIYRELLDVRKETNLQGRIAAEKALKACRSENAELRRTIANHSKQLETMALRQQMDATRIDKLTDQVAYLGQLLADHDRGAT